MVKICVGFPNPFANLIGTPARGQPRSTMAHEPGLQAGLTQGQSLLLGQQWMGMAFW